MKAVLFAIIAALATSTAAAGDGSLKEALKKQYQNHVLFFRSAFQDGDQEFDSAGKALKDPPSKGWTIYGPVWVNKLDLHADKLVLRGPRVAFANSKKLHARISVPLGKEVKVVIHLDHPLNSTDEAQTLLEQVFSLDEKSCRYALPEYRLVPDIGPNETLYHSSEKSAGTKDQVSPPIAIYTPDPDYSDQARQAGYQGMVTMTLVVNKEGTVSRIRIIEGLGLGLDEKSVEKVKTWRFKPALRNGEPVSIEVSTQVSFQLY